MNKLFLSVLLLLNLMVCVAQKQDDIILSGNAYSFSDVLTARVLRDKQQDFSYFNLLDCCAYQNIAALDATVYFDYKKLMQVIIDGAYKGLFADRNAAGLRTTI